MRLMSYILIILMVSSGVDNLFINLSFQWNKDFISQKLCENRGRPEMKCNGKCQLSKAFKKKEKQERENSSYQFLKYVYTIPCNSLISIDSWNTSIVLKKYLFSSLNHFKQNYFISIFHPPD